MPDPKPGERDREAIGEAWRLVWTLPREGAFMAPLFKAIARARSEGDAAGYARGLEEAAREADRHRGGSTVIVDAIRSLAAAAVLREKPDGEEKP